MKGGGNMASKATERIISMMKKQGVSKPFWNSYIFGVRVELNELPKKLQRGERLFTVIPCNYKGRRGYLTMSMRFDIGWTVMTMLGR